MAKASLNLPIGFSTADFSVYSMRGVDKLVVRAKHGPTKEQIATEPQYAPLRRYQSEFRGVGKAISLIMASCYAVNHLADYNFSGTLTRICKIIQMKDELHSQGQRSILFSKYGEILNGFNLNRKNQFDSIVNKAPEYTISRSEFKVTLKIPSLTPGINFFNPWNLPVYRFIAVLGIIPDMILTDTGYAAANPLMKFYVEQSRTVWIPAGTTFNGTQLEIQLPGDTVLDESGTLVLSLGIEFGTVVSNSLIQAVKHMGCAKVLVVV